MTTNTKPAPGTKVLHKGGKIYLYTGSYFVQLRDGKMYGPLKHLKDGTYKPIEESVS